MCNVWSFEGDTTQHYLVWPCSQLLLQTLMNTIPLLFFNLGALSGIDWPSQGNILHSCVCLGLGGQVVEAFYCQLGLKSPLDRVFFFFFSPTCHTTQHHVNLRGYSQLWLLDLVVLIDWATSYRQYNHQFSQYMWRGYGGGWLSSCHGNTLAAHWHLKPGADFSPVLSCWWLVAVAWWQLQCHSSPG